MGAVTCAGDGSCAISLSRVSSSSYVWTKSTAPKTQDRSKHAVRRVKVISHRLSRPLRLGNDKELAERHYLAGLKIESAPHQSLSGKSLYHFGDTNTQFEGGRGKVLSLAH
jgi:hypothetical protein